MMEDDLTISCSNMKQLGRFRSILRTYTVVLAEGKFCRVMELNLSEEYKSYPPLPKEILFKLPTEWWWKWK